MQHIFLTFAQMTYVFSPLFEKFLNLYNTRKIKKYKQKHFLMKKFTRFTFTEFNGEGITNEYKVKLHSVGVLQPINAG
ncbi:hypothetical protein BAMA_22920 [Bacillus manliponensis]|uniref:Uncharacterized protein n=1 Tax=Bacillus manliponensis TaxID=574376 RepID=A0A073JW29_9BACI|nr:hypothetical protein BAMA_22920 [Bacillus manliponensis]